MLMRLFCAFVAIMAAIGCSSRPAPPQGPEAITLVTAGNEQTPAMLYRIAAGENAPPPPGLILLHRGKGDPEGWHVFARWLQQRGYSSIVPNMSETDLEWDAIHPAIRSAKMALLEAGANPDNLAIAGEGDAALLAFEYALLDSDMQGVMALSPEATAGEFKARDQVQRLGDCALLMVASERDPHGAAIAQALHEAAEGFCELRTFGTAAYGAGLMENVPNARQQAILWLESVLSQGEDDVTDNPPNDG